MSGSERAQSPAPLRCEHCNGAASATDGGTVRCACGSLLARYLDGHIELKCRRCKRTVLIHLDGSPADLGAD